MVAPTVKGGSTNSLTSWKSFCRMPLFSQRNARRRNAQLAGAGAGDRADEVVGDRRRRPVALAQGADLAAVLGRAGETVQTRTVGLWSEGNPARTAEIGVENSSA